MKSGQIVRLKSGGPLMAVVELKEPQNPVCETEQVADCVWFEGHAFVRGKFPANSLEALSPLGFSAATASAA